MTRLLLRLFGCSTVAICGLMVYGAVPPEAEQQAKYEKATTLKDAVSILSDHLENTNRKQYAALLTEASIKAAIDTSISGHERDYAVGLQRAGDEKQREGLQRQADRFLKVWKPSLELISQEGKWPAGTFFIVSNIKKDFANFHVKLQIKDEFKLPSGAMSTGYVVDILSLQYGFSGPSESKLQFKIGEAPPSE